MVRVSGLEVKMVAPNSPRLMVKAKIAPATRAFEIRGRSIFQNIFTGDAPSMAAASDRLYGIDLSAGIIDLKTKGKPTSAWTMGIKKIDVLKFKGGLSNVIIMPKPKVTADVERGSIKIGSKKDESFLFISVSQNLIKKAAHIPVIRAIISDVPAKKREYLIA